MARWSSFALLGVVTLAGAAVALTGCEKKFKGAMMLGGQKISSDELEHGRDVYQHFCRPCHGDEGNGKGASAMTLRPPPRDFRQGMFKFGSTTNGLPTDADLAHIVRFGLKGTAMLPWDVEGGDQLDKDGNPAEGTDLHAVIQYIKTFSPRWQPPKFSQGKMIAQDPQHKDPWVGDREKEGIERGKFLFHMGAQCSSCHPSFATKQEISDFNRMKTKDKDHPNGVAMQPGDFRADMYGSVLKESEYTFDSQQSCTTDADCAGAGEGTAEPYLCMESASTVTSKGTKTCKYKVKLLPPNFLTTDVRSVHVRVRDLDGTEHVDRDHALTDLYRVIGTGIYGTAMPGWKGTAFDANHDAEDDLWALVHYVYSLLKMRDDDAHVTGSHAAADLLNKLNNQPAYAAPPPEEAPAPAPQPEPTEPAPAASTSTSASAEPAASTPPPATSTSAAPSASTSASTPSPKASK